MPHPKIALLRGRTLDSETRLYLQALDPAIQSITGQLYGPHSLFAKTLRSTFQVRPLPPTAGKPATSEILVTDPCFWTPRLPFLYDLQVEMSTAAETTPLEQTSLGFKRWYVDGQNWNLDGKRFVLRGAQAALGGTMEQARAAETVLLVPAPDEATLCAADQQGVGLVVDLRTATDCTEPLLERLAWSPSVLAAIVTADQLAHRHTTCGIPLGLAVEGPLADVPTDLEFDFCAALCDPNQRPPAGLLDKPLIVIRRGVDYADLAAARTACDQLQAELAPEFNLAGYVVTP
jgi:hypothetical protein